MIREKRERENKEPKGWFLQCWPCWYCSYIALILLLPFMIRGDIPAWNMKNGRMKSRIWRMNARREYKNGGPRWERTKKKKIYIPYISTSHLNKSITACLSAYSSSRDHYAESTHCFFHSSRIDGHIASFRSGFRFQFSFWLRLRLRLTLC
jgi:hypothetical protein